MSLQKTYKYLLYFIAGLFFAGVLYDTIGNAISLITPPVTYWGTGMVFITWILLVLYVRKKGTSWKLAGGAKTIVTKLNIQVHLFFFGVIFSLWIPIMLVSTNDSIDNTKLGFRQRAITFLQKRYPRAAIQSQNSILEYSTPSKPDKEFYPMIVLDPKAGIKQRLIAVEKLTTEEAFYFATDIEHVFAEVSGSTIIEYGHVQPTESELSSEQMVIDGLTFE